MSTTKHESVPDQALVDIADYVFKFEPSSQGIDASRLCMLDTMGCALNALDYPDCTKMLGPVVPGTIVPHASRVPGTSHELDPVTATFSFGCMIRWLDENDTFTAAQGSHPSDNLAGILMLADHLSRKRVAEGQAPSHVRDVLVTLVEAYENQGRIAIENNPHRWDRTFAVSAIGGPGAGPNVQAHPTNLTRIKAGSFDLGNTTPQLVPKMGRGNGLRLLPLG